MHRQLDRRFACLEDATLALILSAASGEPLLLIGPPGTAKSMLIKTFCGLAGVDREGSASHVFQDPLTPFTSARPALRFYDPSKLTKEGTLERIHADSMMQSAHVVFLDEVFKGSSAILNSLLSFINERAFYDRGRRHGVPLQCLFAATNELPDSDELQAIWDRFTLRCRVDNVAADRGRIQDMLTKAWPLTYGSWAPGGCRRPLMRPMPRVSRKNILGTDMQLDVLLHRGAGAYICGEETGLIESLERQTGLSAYQSLPFPANIGVFGMPTVVNNVETLANVPYIIERGAEWFNSIGPERNRGTRLFCVSGKVQKPGVYELPLGGPLRDIIFECAGGLHAGRTLKAGHSRRGVGAYPDCRRSHAGHWISMPCNRQGAWGDRAG